MESATTTTITETPAGVVQAWDAVQAAYEAAYKAEMEACRARCTFTITIQKAEPDLTYPWLDPRVAPYLQVETLAKEAEIEARDALIGTPAPHWLAFSVKFQIVREWTDNILNPMDHRDHHRREREFPGTRLAGRIHHFALAAHCGALRRPEDVRKLPKWVRKLSRKVAKEGELVTRGFAILIEDAERLCGQPNRPPQPGARQERDIARTEIYAIRKDYNAPGPADWEAAMAALKAADAASEENKAKDREKRAKLGATIPEGLYVENRFGRHLRWPSLEAFDQDLPHRGATKERRKALEDFLPQYQALHAQLGLEESDAEGDRLFDVMAEAQDVAWATRAPTLNALADKITLLSTELDDEKAGYSDLGYLAQQHHSYLANRALVEVYLDVLRLLGRPLPEGLDFNPRAWIKAYEAAGGGVQETVDYSGLLLGRAFAGADRVACRALEDELYAAPWKARAVRLEVREDDYRTRADASTNSGRFSWVQFTDDDYRVLTPRIHFANESDAAEDRGSEALQRARAI